METSVEQLIKDKSFDSLTGEELVLVQELCENEEEFLTMKQFFQELEGVSFAQKSVVNPEIKASLDNVFGAKHPGIRANWTAPEVVVAEEPRIIPMYQRTWFRVAAILVLIVGTIPFWNLVQTDDKALPKQPEMAKAEQPALEKFTAPENSGKDETHVVAGQTNPSVQEPVLVASLSDEVTKADDFKAIEMSAAPPAMASADFRGDVASDPVLTAVTFSSGREGRNAGLEADLHPFDGIQTRANALSLAEEPEDLLDLLVPAF
ncbi:MAG TPA: hypothetical protein VK151_04055 [Fluviicola sp.]|nr:hypothetical protein [Fluviicola sp.]